MKRLIAAVAFSAVGTTAGLAGGIAPAFAVNSHSQPPGPPQVSGATLLFPPSKGALVLHCNSPVQGGTAGVHVFNQNGQHFNNPGGSCSG